MIAELLAIAVLASIPSGFTWMNGENPHAAPLLETEYFVGAVYFDATYDTRREAELAYAGAGGDLYYGGWRGRAIVQLGARADNYLGEAHLGYELDVLEGVRLDVGIFRSFLERYSYYRTDNWTQHVPLAEESLPPLLKGVRLQIFADAQTKVELYCLTGWRGRTELNDTPSFAFQLRWNFRDWVSFTSNDYFGVDTPEEPGRFRYYTNKQLQLRYLREPDELLTRGAILLGGDFGLEHGGGVSAFGGEEGPEHHVLGVLLAHRLWFWEDRLAWTVGASYLKNAGGYFVGATTTVKAWDFSTALDLLPEEHVKLRAELAHRVTSSDGELRGIFSLLFSL